MKNHNWTFFCFFDFFCPLNTSQLKWFSEHVKLARQVSLDELEGEKGN